MNHRAPEYPIEIEQINPIYLSENIANQRIEQLKNELLSILERNDE